MGNLLIYSAAEIFYIWPRALPRCRRSRASLGRITGIDANGKVARASARSRFRELTAR